MFSQLGVQGVLCNSAPRYIECFAFVHLSAHAEKGMIEYDLREGPHRGLLSVFATSQTQSCFSGHRSAFQALQEVEGLLVERNDGQDLPTIAEEEPQNNLKSALPVRAASFATAAEFFATLEAAAAACNATDAEQFMRRVKHVLFKALKPTRNQRQSTLEEYMHI